MLRVSERVGGVVVQMYMCVHVGGRMSLMGAHITKSNCLFLVTLMVFLVTLHGVVNFKGLQVF